MQITREVLPSGVIKGSIQELECWQSDQKQFVQGCYHCHSETSELGNVQISLLSQIKTGNCIHWWHSQA